MLDLESGENKVLVEVAGTGWYVDGGYLAYVSADGSLFAAPFDLAALELRGEPRLVTEGLSVELGRAAVAVSGRGDLVYREPNFDDRASRTLQWVDREGNEEPFDPEWQAHFEQVAVSPDGITIAAAIRTGDRLDIWTRSTDGSPPVRLTFEGDNRRPSWTPDGESVVFLSNRRTGPTGGRFWEVWQKAANGGTSAELVYSRSQGSSDVQEASVGPNGWLALTSHDPEDANYHVLAARTFVSDAPVPISATPAIEGNPRVSPDGNWVAYYSDETGRGEVYLRPFPDPTVGAKRQVSTGAGAYLAWAPDGTALFHGTNGSMVRTELDLDSGPMIGETTPLFSHAPYVFEDGVTAYGVAPAGDRLLMIRDGQLSALGIDAQHRLVWVTNWPTDLRAIMDD